MYTETLFINQDSTMFKSSLLCAWLSVDQYVYMYIYTYVCVCVS